MKHVLATATCAAALVASLAACGDGENKSTMPSTTSTPHPTSETTASTTATSPPAATLPTATATKTGSATTLAARSTYMYGGLKVLVNLPTEIPIRSRPSMRVYFDFLQAAGKTMADNKADPRLRRLATPRVIKYLTDSLDPKADHSVGTLIFSVTRIQPAGTRFATISGCLDQDKALPMNKAGKPIPDTNPFPILKMRGDVSDLGGAYLVTGLLFTTGRCS